MKISINKYQSGGGMPPFTYYEPLSFSNNGYLSTYTNKEANDSEGQLTEKDLFTMLKDIDALPSDIQVIMRNLSNSFNSFSYSRSGLSEIASKYLKTLSKIKTANFNKEYYDQAYKNAIEKNALDEVAITEQGKIVVSDENGELLPITVEEFYKNSDKYSPITNSNLLYLRAHNSGFNNTYLKLALNSISLQEINKMIQDSISNLGSTILNITGYSKTLQGKIQQGFAILDLVSDEIKSGKTINGLYKDNIIDKNQAELAMAAFEYVYQMLPLNAKALLKYHTGGNEENLLKLLTTLISSKLDSQFTFDTNLISDINGNKLSSNASNSGDLKMNIVAQFLQGYGQKEPYTLSDGTSDGIVVWGNHLPITDSTGNSVIDNSVLSKIIPMFGRILDTEHATMGDCRLDNLAFDKVIFSGQARRLDLPLDTSNPNEIKPDLKALKRLNLAQTEIREGNITDTDKINEIYLKYRLPFMYNQDGSINTTNWKTFMVLSGTALSNAFENPDEVELSTFLTEKSLKKYPEKIKNILDTIVRDTELTNKDLPFGKRDRAYEGNIFIPVDINYFNALAGLEMTGSQEQSLQGKQEILDRQLLSEQMKPTFVQRSLLN